MNNRTSLISKEQQFQKKRIHRYQDHLPILEYINFINHYKLAAIQNPVYQHPGLSQAIFS